MAAPVQAPSRSSDQPEELQKILALVKERKELAESVQKAYRDRWDQYYGLYRNFRKFKKDLREVRDRDRGGLLLDAQREWGAELFVPYCFTVVETIVPRVISNDPKMIVPPRRPEAVEAARRVQELIDVQQKEINYDLKLQAVARSGLKYGIGVGKTFWEKQTRKVLRNVPSRNPFSKTGYQTVEQEIVMREGPQFEPVNISDFFWEPAASSIETAGWVIHRTWRSPEYVQKQIESGAWFDIDPEAIKRLSSGSKWNENMQPKLEAAGIETEGTSKAQKVEVWEYHDRENVYTTLADELVVGADKIPFFHRELPFQIYRPTPQEHEFVGIGEIEPIAHLQYELNTLRSQRRDNATLVLQKAFFYAEGFVDPDQLKIGPGRGIPIRGTNIRDVVQVIDFGDIPASGYQEESAIKEDIERTTGVSDAVAGAAGSGTTGSETATGIQLIQAAANVRIALKTKNLLAETVRPAGRQWQELNRQHFPAMGPQQIRVPDEAAEGGMRFEEVGPKDVLADLDDPVPDGGSTEPDNPVQRQSAATTMYQTLQGNPQIDQGKLAAHFIREYGIADPESFVLPPSTVPVDPRVLGEQLVSLGFPEEAVLGALDAALAAATGSATNDEASGQEQTDAPTEE